MARSPPEGVIASVDANRDAAALAQGIGGRPPAVAPKKERRGISRLFSCCMGRDRNAIVEQEQRVAVEAVDPLPSKFTRAVPEGLLGPVHPSHRGRKCLVLDLDETLVHSSFKPVESADIIVPIQIEADEHMVYVRKRPGVDQFLRAMAAIYEVVIFTASLPSYADPLLDSLDPDGLCCARLYRSHCTFQSGSFIKDLSRLGRPMSQIIIIDNSPVSYLYQPANAIPVESWISDKTDTELLDLIPILRNIAQVSDVTTVLGQVPFGRQGSCISLYKAILPQCNNTQQ
ncbi:hypothetical protein KIPB_010128 [Kipferlia bialata]|uniref:FCP1 homology domain-containing protein n=1 Tax=Kipferlia bialata TaxID=797122 RepID=A0A9K3GLC0_9EUKA|nr:hypothetical protein KIPB_010128 [Kipferlia bialata]|eukprot:g10128.t1